MESKRKKIGTAATAALLIFTLGLAGTFAWSGGEDSDGDIEDTIAPEVKLHDDNDFNDTQTVNGVRNRDIYVENAGNTKLYVRVRLDEYMEIGGRSLIPGTSRGDKSSWKPHVYKGGNNGICGEEFHDYFEWHLGNMAPVAYKSKVKNYYDDTTIVRDKQTGTAAIVSMKEYHEAQVKPTNCWVVDTDGYAYWYTQLDRDTATGLLLDSIQNSGEIDENYYYGMNAKLEAVTESDLDSWLNGTAPTGSVNPANRATVEGVQFLKDISPSYIRITARMNLTIPPASEFDGDHDGYLTKAEYKEYGKATGTVRINGTTFPDAIFRNYVETNLDMDGNGELTQDELQAVVSLNVSNQGIESLKGIENFTSLTDLDCSYNKLISLKLNNNINLTTVAADNQAVELKLMYGTGITAYRSEKGLFDPGTAFGASDITVNAGTGAMEMKVYTAGKTSTFSTPLTYGAARVSSNLTGTLTFKVEALKDIVKEAQPGDTINLTKQDGSLKAWTVLTKNATQMELISKDMVTAMTYSNAGGVAYPKWSGSQVRTYLNGTFYHTLSNDVKSMIKEETNLITPTVFNDFSQTETTSDKIYVLCQGGTSGTGDETVITPSGKNLTKDAVLKEFLKCENKTDDGTNAGNNYWLRSPRGHANCAAFVISSTGAVGSVGSGVLNVYGVRPAMTLNLQ